MVKVSASLLAADFASLGEDVKRAEKAGSDFIHIDVMDGYYVPNMALSPYEIRALKPLTNLPFHVHFEVSDPIQIMKSFTGLGIDLIIVQADTCKDFKQVFKTIRSLGAKVGLGLNPQDSIEEIRPYLKEIDLLLIMAVNPGFGNQTHGPETPSRAALAKKMLEDEGIDIPIGSDGGINPINAVKLINSGVSHLIVGTSLFQSENMALTIQKLKNPSEF